MHGRKKVQRSAEEEEKKNKERVQKLSFYQGAMKFIFENRKKIDEEEKVIQLSAKVLISNPDIGTLWNVRKELILALKDRQNIDSLPDDIINKELDLTETCLKSNPKSYGAWHHRTWLLTITNFKTIEQELKLCSKFLEIDDRNFHCWDYRRYLVDNCSRSLEEEFDFTTEKIMSNFSNYSSWHLRSKVLENFHDFQKYLSSELEVIKNAAFTDPNDQSVWLYYRWLLKSQLKKDPSECIFYKYCTYGTLSGVVFAFNAPIEHPVSLKQIIPSLEENEKIELDAGSWSNPWNYHRSKLWIYTASPENHNKNNWDSLVKFNLDLGKYFDSETKPKSEVFKNLVKKELEWVQELNILEPDNKWIISTLILLMRLIDFVFYKDQILEFVTTLIDLDPNRSNYYHDLRSKYVMEWKLVNFYSISSSSESEKVLSDEIDLSNMSLTSVYYLERLASVKTVNLSGNSLHESVSLSALINCERLILQ